MTELQSDLSGYARSEQAQMRLYRINDDGRQDVDRGRSWPEGSGK